MTEDDKSLIEISLELAIGSKSIFLRAIDVPFS
jgi:hypothetical protein